MQNKQIHSCHVKSKTKFLKTNIIENNQYYIYTQRKINAFNIGVEPKNRTPNLFCQKQAKSGKLNQTQNLWKPKKFWRN